MMRLLVVILILISFFAEAQDDQLLYPRKRPKHHEWSYSGLFGPEHWAELEDDYRACAGRMQSPINIVRDNCFTAELDLELHYRPFYVDLINNGHTLIENVVESKALTLNRIDYTLIQFHFHTPSEHHLNDNEYPMEMHFVHQSTHGKYLVMAVLIKDANYENPFLAHFISSLPKEVDQEIRSTEKADIYELLPPEPLSFFYYAGSLTTPPCTEGVDWIVLEDPVSANFDQIEAIHAIIHDDNRPVQALNDRIIFHN